MLILDGLARNLLPSPKRRSPLMHGGGWQLIGILRSCVQNIYALSYAPWRQATSVAGAELVYPPSFSFFLIGSFEARCRKMSHMKFESSTRPSTARRDLRKLDATFESLTRPFEICLCFTAVRTYLSVPPIRDRNRYKNHFTCLTVFFINNDDSGLSYF